MLAALPEKPRELVRSLQPRCEWTAQGRFQRLDPNGPLERSLDLFSRGMALSDACRKQLEEAETRVEMLIRKDGATQTEPFRPEK